MFELIGKQKALTYFSIINAIFSLLAYYFLSWVFHGWPSYKILTIGISAPSITLIMISAGNRMIWSIIRKFNSSFYPDINGHWEGELQFGVPQTTLPLKAHVRVGMFDMSMDFQTSTSDSITISMALRTDKGQHHLDYIYRNDSRSTDRPSYEGTATLRVELSDGNLTMRGRYFTVRSHGLIQLKRIGS